MILKHETVKSDFIKEIKDKKVYCYGAGKVFEDFQRVYSNVNICAVIDKRLSALGQHILKNSISVLSVEQFAKTCDKDTCLVITCFDYQGVEKELDNIKELDDINCYVYSLIQGMYDVKDEREISDRYQITEFKLQDYNAGQKAPSDVAIIAARSGYKIVSVNRGTKRYGLSQTETEWKRIISLISDDSIVLIQLPLVDCTDGIKNLIAIKHKKNIKVIAVVHDIDILRGEKTEYSESQYDILKTLPDVWIVHNQYMINELGKLGFDRDRMFSLDIFDYIIDDYKEIKYKDGVVIAGNLDRQKSQYVYDLNRIDNVVFNLFGANYSEKGKYDNINYYGAFLPDELINNLTGKYGLVWDGNSIETCSGEKGEYLRINNPHKLSLYLAVGLPIIIWSEAAEAEFVLNENVGLTVSSLYELPDKLASISEEEYTIMKENAIKVGKTLRNGKYIARALKKAEILLQERK